MGAWFWEAIILTIHKWKKLSHTLFLSVQSRRKTMTNTAPRELLWLQKGQLNYDLWALCFRMHRNFTGVAFQFAWIVISNYNIQHASMLPGLLLAIVFDQVYSGLTVESANCVLDLEKAEGSSDRVYHVQLIHFPFLSLSLYLNQALRRVAVHTGLFWHSLMLVYMMLLEWWAMTKCFCAVYSLSLLKILEIFTFQCVFLN